MHAIEINRPEIWRDHLPKPGQQDHKYNRGLCVIIGASELTGASRLAAESALHSGVGLIRLIAQRRADIYRTILPPDIMVTSETELSDKRITALLAGPGGITAQENQGLGQAFSFPLILDSAALPASEDLPLKNKAALTPHAGEFERLFPDLNPKEPKDVFAAAKRADAVIIAKGACTILASPDGRIVSHNVPNPVLARGGTGDVLAGLVAGLIAQNMPLMEAACAAVWIHSEAAKDKGHSFSASQLADELSAAVDSIFNILSR